MQTKRSLRLIIAFAVLLPLFASAYFGNANKALAQSEEFYLIPPYYGNISINSFFDHNTPTYSHNLQMLRYDGYEYEFANEDEVCVTGVNCYDGHNGYDFALSYQPVLASANGVVSKVEWDSPLVNTSGYGLFVEIRHDVNGQVYFTRYGHLSTTAVVVGQSVEAGHILGTSGSTGGSQGAHLHFDVDVCINSYCDDDNFDFRPIDPFGWLPQDQDDPWDPVAHSWCMWIRGQYANICNSSYSIDPILPYAEEWETIVNDSTSNSGGFVKGINGNGSNTCTGADPGCRGWFDSPSEGYGGRSYRTVMDGYFGNYSQEDNWAKWKPQSFAPGIYEIFVYIPEYSGLGGDTFTWQAHYTVVDSFGIINDKLFAQFILPSPWYYNPRGKWLSLGIHSLGVNSAVFQKDDGENWANNHCPNGYVVNGHPMCRVATDAIKFVKRHYSFIYLPLAIGDN